MINALRRDADRNQCRRMDVGVIQRVALVKMVGYRSAVAVNFHATTHLVARVFKNNWVKLVSFIALQPKAATMFSRVVVP